jgi:hypothetical protein
MQLVIAAIPFGRDRDWAIFLATAGGTLLSKGIFLFDLST